MNPLFHTEFSISDSLKNVRKSVLIYETIIIGDTVEDIKVCRELGGMCISAAWKRHASTISLEKENPDYVFRYVQELYEYFQLEKVPQLKSPPICGKIERI